MRPTYIELLRLTPLLQRRSPEEVESLMDAIEECGYIWDPAKERFYNPETSQCIRTQGLDVFTAERFREMQFRFKQEKDDHPEAEAVFHRYQQLWATWIIKLLGAIFLWGILGWIIAGWKLWLLVLLALIFGFVCFFIYCSKGWKKADKMKSGEM